jgi:hypothetical protein
VLVEGGVVETISTTLKKTVFGRQNPLYAVPECGGVAFACNASASQFLFLNHILYLLKCQISPSNLFITKKLGLKVEKSLDVSYRKFSFKSNLVISPYFKN